MSDEKQPEKDEVRSMYVLPSSNLSKKVVAKTYQYKPANGRRKSTNANRGFRRATGIINASLMEIKPRTNSESMIAILKKATSRWTHFGASENKAKIEKLHEELDYCVKVASACYKDGNIVSWDALTKMKTHVKGMALTYESKKLPNQVWGALFEQVN